MIASEQFQQAIAGAGLPVPEVIHGDGTLYRFSTNGKRMDQSGWYVLHDDGDVPAGAFGCWRSGLQSTWCAKSDQQMTPAERDAHRQRIKAIQQQRDTEQAQRQQQAAQSASDLLAQASPAQANHPYLVKKGVQAHGIKVFGDNLLIALRDTGGKLHSLQTIGPDGDKRFHPGGRIAGCYFGIGKPADLLVIAEGFATGASIHEATGHAVAVAFTAGNLLAVAQALRAKFPTLRLIVAADDDWKTDGNPGMTKAREATEAIGGMLAVPRFPANRPDGATDFNDLHQLAGGGLDAVKVSFADAIESVAGCASDTGAGGQIDAESMQAGTQESAPVSEPDPVQATHTEQVTPGGDTTDTTDTTATTEGSEAPLLPPSPFPGLDERPRYVVLDDWTKSSDGNHKPGVYYCGLTAGKKDSPPEPFDAWICSPMHIDAVTFDGQSNNFGRLLRFKPTVGKWREWAMPMELLAGDGAQLRGELLAMGVELDPYKARQQLPHYLQSEHPKRRIHCALQVGWCGDSFVLPDAVIGPKSADVIFQSGERGHEEHTQAGTLAGWRDGIAAKAVGNPLLMLAVSASFAGPLLARCNSEGGGFHVVGDSSTGKTTLIEAACATWGGPGFKRSWRATANGMEGAAAMFNDCLLALDEISECDPKEVGAIVYALGNGRGKQRASRSGNARGVTRWRCFVISSGERTIATTMQEGGHRAKAGQSMRLLDIPAAQTYGAWDALHGATSPAAFSDAIKRAAAQHHGQAGRAFLEKLTFDTSDLCAMLEEVKAAPMFATDGTEGQDKRAAARFALIGLAGELATDYGVTGWPVGAAGVAAEHGFKLWQSMRGKGNDERRQILQRVSGFIERHGDGRFSDADTTNDVQIRDRAGWWRDTSGGREYLFTTDGMREATKGIDFKRALDVLQEANALPTPGANGERARFFRIAGRGVKLYPVDPDKLAGGEHGA